jgi:hypothetical protein
MVGASFGHLPHPYFPDAKDISKQVRCSVRDLRLVKEVAGSCYENSAPSYFIERAQMLSGRSQRAQGGNVGGSSIFRI